MRTLIILSLFITGCSLSCNREFKSKPVPKEAKKDLLEEGLDVPEQIAVMPNAGGQKIIDQPKLSSEAKVLCELLTKTSEWHLSGISDVHLIYSNKVPGVWQSLMLGQTINGDILISLVTKNDMQYITSTFTKDDLEAIKKDYLKCLKIKVEQRKQVRLEKLRKFRESFFKDLRKK